MSTENEKTQAFIENRYRLFGYIYGLARNSHDAEDILQEVWVRFHAAAHQGTDIQDPFAWSRGVARNLILHYWRDRKADKVIVDQDLVDLVGLAFAESDVESDRWADRKEALRDCLRLLPESARILLHLKYARGLTADAVGAMLRKTADAVLRSLSRIRFRLRECIDKKLNSRGRGCHEAVRPVAG